MTALAIAAYRRPYYLERQFDAWRRVRGIEQVEGCYVTLGWSARITDQMAVIKRFTDWAPFPVEVAVDDPAVGHNTGIGYAIAYAFDPRNGHDFVYFQDEDILPADDVLELVNWGRDKYAADARVLTVHGHAECGQGWDGPFQRDDPDADPAVIRLKKYFNAWGFGTWRDRWEKVIHPEWDWTGARRGYDWNLQNLMHSYDRLSVTPDASRTQHIGYRGGVFANAQTLAFSDSASFREHRDPVEFRCES